MSGQRSIYERRFADPLRRLLGRDKKPAAVALNRWGEPTYVTSRGRIIGVRDVDGQLVRFPDQPPANRPDLWPEIWWEPDPE